MSLALASLCLLAAAAGEDEWRTQVVLDSATFSEPSRGQLSRTAEHVAREIDRLIPGKPIWKPEPRILCFVSPANWPDKPVVLFGKRHMGEPQSVRAHSVRVAVRSNVLPGAYQRFAFQLAHELAHVKMDPRLDNDLIETFAVATSLEVMDRLGYASFVETNEHYYAQSMPKEVQAAMAARQIDNLSAYLRYRLRHGAARPQDYSLQVIGAIIIRADKSFPWRHLLGIASKGKCAIEPSQVNTKVCEMNVAALPEFKSTFERLGVNGGRLLVQRRTSKKPRDGTFTFQENGKWVSLLEVRDSGSLPKGFSIVQ